MHPVLLDLGTVRIGALQVPVVIGSYGVFYALALATGGVIAWRLGRSFAPRFPWLDMVFATSIAGYLGAKVANALVFLPDILAGRKPMLAALTGGGVWLGAIAGGAVVAGYFLRKYRLPVGTMVNVVFVAVPAAHVLGRTGCFLAGCCYGKPTSLPWGVVFRDPWALRFNGTPLDVSLHPTQLYEAGLEGINALVAWSLWRRSAPPWSIAATWVGLYGAERFVLETFRGDPRGQFGPLATSQWAALVMVAASVTTLFWVYLRRNRDSDPPPVPRTAGRRKKRRGSQRGRRSPR